MQYNGFIVQKPNETFLQITAGETSIAFVGGIQVDLIDGCGDLVTNIDSNFYYEGFVDSSGVNQIAFEFVEKLLKRTLSRILSLLNILGLILVKVLNKNI